jgi:hypothetical protein
MFDKMITQELVNSLFKARTGEAVKGYKFAIIAKNSGKWFDESQPTKHIRIIGFFNDAGEILPPSDELCRKAERELANCGEFADTLVREDQVDYISLGR